MSEGARAGQTASDFVAGFAGRHAVAADLLHQAFAPAALPEFRAVALGAPPTPRHFSPADPARKPTAGWDPLDPAATANPHLDPLADAHAAGFAEGHASATLAAAAERERDKALLADLATALAAAGRVDRERVARHLRQTVMALVAKLVGETGVSAELLAARVAAATELLADAAESALLRVNPADVALLEGKLPTTVFAVGDAAVARGSFVMESASAVVEDGPELWLDRMAAAIDRAAVPATAAPSC